MRTATHSTGEPLRKILRSVVAVSLAAVIVRATATGRRLVPTIAGDATGTALRTTAAGALDLGAAASPIRPVGGRRPAELPLAALDNVIAGIGRRVAHRHRRCIAVHRISTRCGTTAGEREWVGTARPKKRKTPDRNETRQYTIGNTQHLTTGTERVIAHTGRLRDTHTYTQEGRMTKKWSRKASTAAHTLHPLQRPARPAQPPGSPRPGDQTWQTAQ